VSQVKALIAAGAVLTLSFSLVQRAEAVPSFAQQTGQPCAACHVGAFGPQLTPYGRDFKLYGYTPSDGQSHLPPISFSLQSSYTHTVAAQESLVAQDLKANDNFLIGDQLSAYYAGQITKDVGAFIQATYAGAGSSKVLQWDNVDIRYAHPLQLFGEDTVLGITLNNSPTVQDLWNSTPSWGFPYDGSPLGPAPAAATLADGGLAGLVFGAGAYAMWKDLLFVEGCVYSPLSQQMLDHLGANPGPGSDVFSGAIPYGRVALQYEGDKHYFQAGAFAFAADRYPGGDRSAGTDRFLDRALDANYQFTGSKTYLVSAHAIYIHEDENLRADQMISGTLPNDSLRTFRADISFSYKNTWTPSLQYFSTTGSNDAANWGTPNGSPDSSGYLAELAYVPLGKAKSLPHWANVRLSLQYVSYRTFDGSSRGASANNTLYLNFWIAVAPLYAVETNFLPRQGTH
jgi:hypothetical protein